MLRIFRRREHRSPRTPVDELLSPREEFFTLWAHFGRQRAQLVTIAALSGALNLILGSAYIIRAQSSMFVPYLYVTDKTGEVVPLGAAKELTVTDLIVSNALGNFFKGIRSVYSDPHAQGTAVRDAYVYIPRTPGATSRDFVGAYFADNDPRTLAERFTRTVEIIATTKLPRQAGATKSTSVATWRVRWRETTYNLGAPTALVADWDAFVTVRIKPKRKLEAFDPNPMGIYIDSLQWSRLTPERTIQQAHEPFF
jgi:type IV secretion system protein TrbF